MSSVRPLLPPERKRASYIAEHLGTALIPIFFIGLLVSIRYTFSGGDWQCSGSGCLEEFDRLRGWTFPIPLFMMIFVCAFGFVGALLLRAWGRSGRPATFEPKRRRARPALTGVGRTLMWVGILELSLAGAFFSAGGAGALTATILGAVGLVLIGAAWATSRSAERADRILQTGTPAVAEITDVERTGTELNDNPLLRLTLTIYQDGAPLYPVVHKEYIPQHYLGRIQIGARLPVKVDPLDSSSLVIEWDRSLSDAEASQSD